jgi:hypothetical protein
VSGCIVSTLDSGTDRLYEKEKTALCFMRHDAALSSTSHCVHTVSRTCVCVHQLTPSPWHTPHSICTHHIPYHSLDWVRHSMSSPSWSPIGADNGADSIRQLLTLAQSRPQDVKQRNNDGKHGQTKFPWRACDAPSARFWLREALGLFVSDDVGTR